MTKKDFELIADVISDMKRDSTRRDGLVLEATAKRMADALATTNGAFKRERFLAACGFE